MIYQIVFSPTGGTEKVSALLAEGLGAREGKRIDLCDVGGDFEKHALREEDLAVIAVPSYGGRVPAAAAERLGRVKGNGARCVLLCVYGNRAYEDTLVELEYLARGVGLRPVAAVAAVAEHSILRQYAAGRPDESDRKELAEIAARVREKLAEGRETAPSGIPGNRPYKKEGGVPMTPKAGSGCTSCGVCAKACPVGAIPPEDPKTTDSSRCIACMRCLSLCPQAARKVNAAMLAAAGMMLKKACAVRKGCELYL